MSITINDTFIFSDDKKADTIKRDKSIMLALTVAANGIDARKVSDKPYNCKTCQKPLKWIITKSKTAGDIAVMPSNCEPCRLSTSNTSL